MRSRDLSWRQTGSGGAEICRRLDGVPGAAAATHHHVVGGAGFAADHRRADGLATNRAGATDAHLTRPSARPDTEMGALRHDLYRKTITLPFSAPRLSTKPISRLATPWSTMLATMVGCMRSATATVERTAPPGRTTRQSGVDRPAGSSREIRYRYPRTLRPSTRPKWCWLAVMSSASAS